MRTTKEKQKIGREKLQRIIETYKAIEERSLDPFIISIQDDIKTIREYFPEWEIPEDLNLDAETLHHLASVVKLQSEWVKNRSTSLYTDPFLLEEKLRKLDKDSIVETFMQAWRPTIELEQISLNSLKESTQYWESLLPMTERWKQAAPSEVEAGKATWQQLINERILRDKAFSEELESFWKDLKDQINKQRKDGKIPYWTFISAETYEETVQRATMTSFLITYGYATLEIRTLEEEIFIIAYEKPRPLVTNKQLVSVPIAISAEEWRKNRQAEHE